jgi:uncharacterized cupredoxin-like copper-binding protein
MRQRLLVLVTPVILLLVASACAPAPAPAARAALAAEQVTIVGTDDFRMNPATISVRAGQPLQVTFQNGGEIAHDFTTQQGLGKPVTILEQGGQSGTATVTFDKPGTYKFFCAQPGHDQLGMHGTITVQ